MISKTDRSAYSLHRHARKRNLEALLGLMKLKRGDLLCSNKKIRTHKNDFQRAVLIDIFAITKFPSSETREELALILNHTARSIQIWFQNNRHTISTADSDEVKMKFGIDSSEDSNSKKKTVDAYLLGKILENHFSEKTIAAWNSFINYVPKDNNKIS